MAERVVYTAMITKHKNQFYVLWEGLMSTNSIKCVYIVVFACIFFIPIVTAEEIPVALEELEHYEAARIAGESATSNQITSDSVLKQFNLQVLHTKLACIKAVGHVGFCGCISENMPVDQEFSNYVVAVSKTKNELNFDGLSDYYQKTINLARSARDKCVMEIM